jgi:hypothetical protein
VREGDKWRAGRGEEGRKPQGGACLLHHEHKICPKKPRDRSILQNKKIGKRKAKIPSGGLHTQRKIHLYVILMSHHSQIQFQIY